MDHRFTFHRKRAHNPERVTLFSIMRDEYYFLPHFLKHYRELGVQHFCIFADRCSPDFLERLEAENDVTILLGRDISFGDNFGGQAGDRVVPLPIYLRESVCPELFPNQWVLFVDSDEFLLLPPPLLQIEDFITGLRQIGQLYSYAPMVDFYPRTLAGRNFSYEETPFKGAPFFDRGPYHFIETETGRLKTKRHGIRGRLFNYLARNNREELLRAFSASLRIAPPVNFKFPLLKQTGITKWRGCHRVTAPPDLSNACVIAHFKFYPELDSKMKRAITERQYYSGSSEYRFLALAIEKLNERDLLFQGSVKFTSTEDLVGASLIDRWHGQLMGRQLNSTV